MEELGGPMAHAAKSGICVPYFVTENDEDCLR